jgi:hypothetical protein
MRFFLLVGLGNLLIWVVALVTRRYTLARCCVGARSTSDAAFQIHQVISEVV